ncbi:MULTISPECIES: hypothetical protein [unclassified Paenibacillus]|uniref:hypothetical protein n=1 Tax=unclassified Paenibacillus TaxID=185978 RepID=UPI000837E289|nr:MULTISPECIES: hypothetical protein [unclassified Paenibacillus]NWL86694.1 hypothetical protein [Paenibacillus sp. 79R4]
MRLTKSSLICLALALMMSFTFVACSSERNITSNTFSSIDNADIPDILEQTVGTLGNTYFTSGITDNKEYQSYFRVIFENTTEDDYATLMTHYQSDSSGTDENGSLLFEWGWLQVTPEDGSITINAYIK